MRTDWTDTLSEDDSKRTEQIHEHAQEQKQREAELNMRRQFSSHPVRQFLRDCTSGGQSAPTKEAFDALGLPAAARARVEKAVADARELQAAGENQQARELADAQAEAVWEQLPDELRSADYLEKPDDVPTDPAGLAGRVRQW